MKQLTFTLIIQILFVKISLSQWVEQKQITTFSNKLNSPIKIEVLEKEGRYKFYANNKSSYPYLITLKMQTFNLQPENLNRSYVVLPGRNHIVDLIQKSDKVNTNYSYEYRYAIGDPGQIPDNKYPYVLPIGEGKITEFYKSIEYNNYYIDAFSMQEGDTVYCMRKGYVTAIPEMYRATDRIAKSKSLEIRHADGTVMIYENIDDESIFTNVGKKVYPGQPLGLVNSQSHIKVQLYNISGDYMLSKQIINYYTRDSISKFSMKFNEYKSEYPDHIIQKEMTKRETKKYKKGNLR